MLLLQKCLAVVPGLKTEVALNGWPGDPAAFNAVDGIGICCNGGTRHLSAATGDFTAGLWVLVGNLLIAGVLATRIRV